MKAFITPEIGSDKIRGFWSLVVAVTLASLVLYAREILRGPWYGQLGKLGAVSIPVWIVATPVFALLLKPLLSRIHRSGAGSGRIWRRSLTAGLGASAAAAFLVFCVFGWGAGSGWVLAASATAGIGAVCTYLTLPQSLETRHLTVSVGLLMTVVACWCLMDMTGNLGQRWFEDWQEWVGLLVGPLTFLLGSIAWLAPLGCGIGMLLPRAVAGRGILPALALGVFVGFLAASVTAIVELVPTAIHSEFGGAAVEQANMVATVLIRDLWWRGWQRAALAGILFGAWAMRLRCGNPSGSEFQPYPETQAPA